MSASAVAGALTPERSREDTTLEQPWSKPPCEDSISPYATFGPAGGRKKYSFRSILPRPGVRKSTFRSVVLARRIAYPSGRTTRRVRVTHCHPAPERREHVRAGT